VSLAWKQIIDLPSSTFSFLLMLFASVEDRDMAAWHQPFARAGPMVGCEWWQHT
jgi:hypothetical protein